MQSAVDGRRYSNAAKKGEELASAGNSEGDSVAFMLGLCYKVNALISSQDTTDYLSDINTIKVMYPAFKKMAIKKPPQKWHRHWGNTITWFTTHIHNHFNITLTH